MGVFEETKEGMNGSLEHLRSELKNMRSNRPNAAILDGVVVEAYGSEMRIRDLAQVGIDGRQLVITPFDVSTANSIAKGIEKANLNLQGIVDGNIIRVPIPPMTEDLRKDLVKQARKKGEEAKVGIRENRRKGNDAVKKLKTESEIAEDEQKKTEKRIQDLTNDFCKQVDDLIAEKEKELMEV